MRLFEQMERVFPKAPTNIFEKFALCLSYQYSKIAMGASMSDFFDYRLYSMRRKKKNTFITARRQNKLEKKYRCYRGEPQQYIVNMAIENQAEFVSALNPTTLNCLRMLLYVDKNSSINVIAESLMVGVDNTCCDDGIFVAVKKELSATCSVGVDRSGRMYTIHPNTHSKLIGISVPNTTEILEAVGEQVVMLQKKGFIGIDVAFADDGKGYIVNAGSLSLAPLQMPELHGFWNECRRAEKK